jgi:hypothetical protein
LGGKDGKAMLAEVDRICLHDAVLNVAMVWKDIWGIDVNRISRERGRIDAATQAEITSIIDQLFDK